MRDPSTNENPEQEKVWIVGETLKWPESSMERTRTVTDSELSKTSPCDYYVRSAEGRMAFQGLSPELGDIVDEAIESFDVE